MRNPRACGAGAGEGQGESFEDKYQLDELIRRGGCGEVWRCTETATGAQFACKLLQTHPPGELQLRGSLHGWEPPSEDLVPQGVRPVFRLRESLRKTPKLWATVVPKMAEPLWARLRPPLSREVRVRLSSLNNEASILQWLMGKHQGVIQLHDLVCGPSSVHLVMDLCHGGDLQQLVAAHGPLPEPGARQVFRQLAATLKYLHSMGVVHRDVKPANVLFDKPAT